MLSLHVTHHVGLSRPELTDLLLDPAIPIEDLNSRVHSFAAAYVRALKLRAAYAPALDGIARTYESRAKEVEAEEHYRRAIELSDNEAERRFLERRLSETDDRLS